jgi:hypothetical protein
MFRANDLSTCRFVLLADKVLRCPAFPIVPDSFLIFKVINDCTVFSVPIVRFTSSEECPSHWLFVSPDEASFHIDIVETNPVELVFIDLVEYIQLLSLGVNGS